MEESPREKLAPTRNQQGLDGGSSGLRLEPASLAESSAPAILYHGHDLLIINKVCEYVSLITVRFCHVRLTARTRVRGSLRTCA